MQHPIVYATCVLSLAAACNSQLQVETAEAPEETAEPTTEVEAPAEPEPEPTEEEKAQAEAAERLARDRKKMRADHEAELSRLTPEVRAQAKAIADKKYPRSKAALQAVSTSPHRKPENVKRDPARHPLATLELFGFEPTQRVLEYGPGAGWYTEILAPALSARGKLIATNSDPDGPPEDRSTYYGERFKLFLDKAPELYGEVQTVIISSDSPELGLEEPVDLVLAIRTLHGLVTRGTLDGWLAEFHKALKPKGVLGVVQHRAAPDAVPEESAKKGYLPQAWVVSKIEAAGFKLADTSEINKNPKDTKDYPDGVWTLPPTYMLGDEDREKYTEIGESDRMTLKFVKVAK